MLLAKVNFVDLLLNIDLLRFMKSILYLLSLPGAIMYLAI